MTGEFADEAFARILSPAVMADLEHLAASAEQPSRRAIAEAARIFAPTVNRLTKQRQQTPDMADAA